MLVFSIVSIFGEGAKCKCNLRHCWHGDSMFVDIVGHGMW